MNEILELVKLMCGQIVEASEKRKITVEEAEFRLRLIEGLINE